MAVQEQTPRIEYVANGVAKSFPLTFDCEDQDHLIVTIDDNESSVGSWQLIDNSVVFRTAPATGSAVTIQRNSPFERTTTYQTYNNSFRPGPVNKDLDRIWWKLQELGLADWLLSKRLDRETQDRILADLALKADYILRDSKLKEDYISRDKALEKDYIQRDAALKKYIDSMIALVTGDPSFHGVDAGMVTDSSGLSQQQINHGVESIEALRLLRPKSKGERVYLVSANKDQNEGGGVFVAAQKAGLVDNGGTIIATQNPSLFYVRINYRFPTLEMFGAKGNDPTFDSYDAIQRCFDSVVELDAVGKSYYISEGVTVPDKLKKITGVTQTLTQFIKTTTHKKNVRGELIDFTMYLDYKSETEDITYYKKLSDFEIAKSPLLYDTGHGLYMHKAALSQFNNLRISRFDMPIRSSDSWMVQWDRVTTQGNNGWKITSGTSNVFSACWTIGVTGICYDFQNLLYSTMIGCGADFSGSEGKPAKQIFNIQWSELTIIGMGYEKSHLQRFAYIHDSKVDIVNLRGLMIENKYRNGYGGWLDIVSGSTVTLRNCGFGLVHSDLSAVSSIPYSVYIDNASTLNDTESSLFKTFPLPTHAVIKSANVISDTFGKRTEIINIASSAKVFTTNRQIIANNGFSVEQDPDTIINNGYYHNNEGSSLMVHHMLMHVQHRNSRDFAWQIGVGAGAKDMRDLKARVKSGDEWNSVATIYNSDNVIVDSNGFLKIRGKN